jgi:hypothetical protein
MASGESVVRSEEIRKGGGVGGGRRGSGHKKRR